MPETNTTPCGPRRRTRTAARARGAAGIDHGGLDARFYAGLLQLVGLCEVVVAGKPRVARKPPEAREPGSLLENTLARLEARGRPGRGVHADREARRFDIALRLCLVWISRIVFLKRLEARLLTLHDGDPAYAFLRADRIRTFGELDALFREVLGGREHAASTPRARRFPLVPVFDGAVFGPGDLEAHTIGIGALADEPAVPVLPAAIAGPVPSSTTTASAASVTGSPPPARGTLASLLDFLDSFDFAQRAAGTPAAAQAAPSRIDAAALGLVFEKLHGHRDGSYFTPGRVAMFMCREAVTRAARRRLGERHDSPGEPAAKRGEARAALDALRVCDPAVGSGHLLVSALNEVLALKARLGLLDDLDGRPLTGYRLEVGHDRLVVTRADGRPIDRGAERRKLDAVLFREKRTIVEHGLFGVDLDPDAVGMARLRLWLELLEHAGYDEHGGFATLPNLEANIKQGNATISCLALDDDLLRVWKTGILTVADYRAAAARFRTATTDAVQKRAAARELAGLKAKLLQAGQPEESRGTVTNGVHDDAFEWRIEFPEVLADDGAFAGFDVVIANPPYIDSERMVNAGHQALRGQLAQAWPCARGNWDLYIVFMALGLALLGPRGAMAYLTPDKWLSNPFGDAFRARHLDRIERIVVLGRDVFERALVDSIVTIYGRESAGSISTARLDRNVLTPLADTPKHELEAPWPLDALLSPHHAFVTRLVRAHARLDTLLRCENACATSDAYRLAPLIEEAGGRTPAGDVYRLVNTGTLGRFVPRWGTRPMTYLRRRYAAPVVSRTRFAQTFAGDYRDRAGAKKVLVKGLTRLDASLDLRGELLPGKTTLVLRSDDDALLKYVAAILNCPLSIFVIEARFGASSYNGGVAFTKAMIDALPVPAGDAVRADVVRLVDRLLRLRETGGDDAAARGLERTIERVLYAGYGLSEAEIALVERGARPPRRV